jgi:hypothetical protein
LKNLTEKGSYLSAGEVTRPADFEVLDPLVRCGLRYLKKNYLTSIRWVRKMMYKGMAWGGG